MKKNCRNVSTQGKIRKTSYTNQQEAFDELLETYYWCKNKCTSVYRWTYKEKAIHVIHQHKSTPVSPKSYVWPSSKTMCSTLWWEIQRKLSQNILWSLVLSYTPSKMNEITKKALKFTICSLCLLYLFHRIILPVNIGATPPLPLRHW